jgi:superfamily II DNA or RNA helicase
LLDIKHKKLVDGIPEEKIKERPFEYRYYQRDSIEALLKNGHGRGLIEVPTAGGKSFVIANFIWNIWKHIDKTAKTLILVPNTQLVA